MSKNPFLNHSFCVQRLIEDYKKHGNLIVAFDFDNTIYDYHHKGYDMSEVIDLLARCSAIGFTMVLFTAQEIESEINWRVLYCNDRKIKVDYVNESPIMKTVKPYYNILLDDRSGLAEAFEQLKEVVEYVEARRIVIGSTNEDGTLVKRKVVYSLTDFLTEINAIKEQKLDGWWYEDRKNVVKITI